MLSKTITITTVKLLRIHVSRLTIWKPCGAMRFFFHIGCYLHTLHEKCPNAEFFLVHIFRIWTKYGKIRTRKNSLFGHFLRSDIISAFRYSIDNSEDFPLM